MWLFGSAVNDTLSSFISNILPSGIVGDNQLASFTEMYDDAIHTINEMRERSDADQHEWIEKTTVKQDLVQMVDVLVKEENALGKKKADSREEKEEKGSCMNYLIQNHVIDTLCGVAMIDNPRGSTALVVSMLTKLFKEVKYPLLSSEAMYVSISGLVQKLMKIYQGSGVTPDLESAIIDFVEVLCNKLCEDPVLINAFFFQIDDPSSPNTRHISFPLVEPLIPHINDISHLGTTARRTLLLLAAFPMTDLSIYLVRHTSLLPLLSQSLLDSILQLRDPPTDHPQSVLPEDSLRTRLLFLSELLATAKGSADCKDVPAQSLVLYHALLDAVSDTVLKGFLAVELLSIQNTRIIFATRVLRCMISTLLPTPASPLLDLLLRFLFASDSPLLFPSLLARINSNSRALSITTLHLFNELLKSQHPVVMKALLPVVEADAVPCGQFYEAFCAVFTEPLPCGPLEKKPTSAVASCLSDVEHAAAAAQACRAVELAVESIGEEEKGAMKEEKGAMKEEKGAMKEEKGAVKEEKGAVKEDKPAEPEANKEETPAPQPTRPGETTRQTASDTPTTPFLEVVTARLRMLLRQPLEINLEVTQIIATLAIVAPAPLFSKLFLSAAPHSIAWELNALWSKAVTRSKEVRNFERYLRIAETCLNTRDDAVSMQREDQLSVDATFNLFLEGYIVLKEFLTELSCSMLVRSSSLFTVWTPFL
ncbi:hypothetical protein WA556_001833 [Blastocystis sp. ATCC 50177/Nand II]